MVFDIIYALFGEITPFSEGICLILMDIIGHLFGWDFAESLFT